jgi:hypothetical protein
MKISTILDHIDTGHMALPVFQRGYVWNREQVRGMMNSLYRRHPVGSLLVWVTESEGAEHRGNDDLPPGVVNLLLDGQQRITSLYGLSRGRTPEFFDGNASAFTGLFFHLEREEFEFHSPIKMKEDPLWIDVTALLKEGNEGLGRFVGELSKDPELAPRVGDYIGRLSRILGILDVDLHVDEVTGSDKTMDVVVDIFNRVNSGGTKLSQGDLALAKICSSRPLARDEMKALLASYEQAGFSFDLDWVLRNINTVLTGEARFPFLHNVSSEDFHKGLKRTERALGYLLDLVSGRLGLDHDRVLFGRYAFPVMSRYVAQRGGRLPDVEEQGKLLYWYLQSAMWGRFSGSTESNINEDIEAFESEGAGLDGLIRKMRLWRGDLTVRPDHFGGWSRGARFYPMLYLLTRVGEARDFGTGLPLKSGMLGHNAALQIHHLFPKALLRKAGYRKDQINAIANFCFLTQTTNLEISDKRPEVYFRKIERRFPGALASQWIPMDPELWKVDRYSDFLEARRKLLTDSANQLLEHLLSGAMSELPEVEDAAGERQTTVAVPGGVESTEEEQLIRDCNDWVVAKGLPSGEYMYELVDPESVQPLAVFDLAWPNGLQQGLSEPVVLLIDEGPDTLMAANRAGYRYFTLVEEFQDYVEQEVLVLGDDPEESPESSREYWVDKRSEEIVQLVEKLVEAVGASNGRRYLPNYNLRQVGLLDDDKGRTFVHCYPRTSHLRVATEVADREAWRERLDAAGFGYVTTSKRWVKFNLGQEDLQAQRKLLEDLFREAGEAQR